MPYADVERRRQYHRNRRAAMTPEVRAADIARVEKYQPRGKPVQRTQRYRHKILSAREISAGRPKPAHCEVCGGTKKIVWDHCHVSGGFRGWICNRCNLILGQIRDCPETLVKLAVYLEKFSMERAVGQREESLPDAEAGTALARNLARQRQIAEGLRVVNTQGRDSIALADQKYSKAEDEDVQGWMA